MVVDAVGPENAHRSFDLVTKKSLNINFDRPKSEK
jgi:hypothetical protein